MRIMRFALPAAAFALAGLVVLQPSHAEELVSVEEFLAERDASSLLLQDTGGDEYVTGDVTYKVLQNDLHGCFKEENGDEVEYIKTPAGTHLVVATHTVKKKDPKPVGN